MSQTNSASHYCAFELTEKGMELRQKAVAGEKTGIKYYIDFTRGAIGQGRPEPDMDLFYMTDLVDHAWNVPIKESYAEHRNHLMTIVIDNAELNEELLMTEIGIFARLEDDAGNEVVPEILYGYTYTHKYDYIPVADNYFLYREIRFNTVLSREGKFEIVFDKTKVYVTHRDLDDALKAMMRLLTSAKGAKNIGFDNIRSELQAVDVQDAIDELDANLDALNEKYYRQAMTGNVQDYVGWARDFPLIGNVRVQPLWAGANTVRLLIADHDREPANQTLVDCFQFYLDPSSAGLGNGVAPIGVYVTVAPGMVRLVDIGLTVQLKAGFSEATAQKAVRDYLELVAAVKGYLDCTELTDALQKTRGIAGVSDVLLDGDTQAIVLQDDEIPVLNTLTLEVV